MANEGRSRQVLSQNVSHHVTGRAINEIHDTRSNSITKSKYAKVNVFRTLAMSRSLGKSTSRTIVNIQRGGSRLRETKAVKGASKPLDVIGGFASRHELGLCGGGGHTALELSFPRKSSAVEEMNKGTNRTTSVGASSPISVRKRDQAVSVRQVGRIEDAKRRGTLEVSKDMFGSSQMFVAWGLEMSRKLRHRKRDVGPCPGGKVVEGPNKMRIEMRKRRVDWVRAVVVPEKGGRRERCGGRVAVRETELLDKVASKGLLREHD
jgi:hypothetical protein